MNNIQKVIVWDIETAPDDELIGKLTEPYERKVWSKPPFDRDSVKCGHILKGEITPEKEEKAELHRDKKELDYNNLVSMFEAKQDEAEDKYYDDAYKKATLDPFKSNICAIGVDTGEVQYELYGKERDILIQFWSLFSENQDALWTYYSGSNTGGSFDVYHVVIRSRMNNIQMPFGIVNIHSGRFTSAFVDLAKATITEAKWGSFLGLDKAAEAYSLIGEDVGFATVRSKEELKLSTGVTGANFHKLLVDDPEVARAYLINDLALTRALADRILC